MKEFFFEVSLVIIGLLAGIFLEIDALRILTVAVGVLVLGLIYVFLRASAPGTPGRRSSCVIVTCLGALFIVPAWIVYFIRIHPR